jgi:carbon storage regulator
MLVLSRRDGEAIQVGEDVFVRVIRCRGGRVCLGIDAPRDVPIVRLNSATTIPISGGLYHAGETIVSRPMRRPR